MKMFGKGVYLEEILAVNSFICLITVWLSMLRSVCAGFENPSED